MAQLAIGDTVPPLRAEGADGAGVELATWWRQSPLVVVYLRHFG